MTIISENQKKRYCLRAKDIMWDVDTDENDNDLPTEVHVPIGMTDEEEIADWLSDTYGFCHKGFSLEKVQVKSEYNIVLKEKTLDEGLTKAEICDMYDLLSGISAIPVEFQGECSTAMEFINLTDAGWMNYDYSKLGVFVTSILNDVENESPNGEYEFDISNNHGISSVIILR